MEAPSSTELASSVKVAGSGKFPVPPGDVPIGKDGKPMTWNSTQNRWFSALTGRRNKNTSGTEGKNLRESLRALSPRWVKLAERMIADSEKHYTPKGREKPNNKEIILIGEMIARHTLAMQVQHIVIDDAVFIAFAEAIAIVLQDLPDSQERGAAIMDLVGERIQRTDKDS